MNPVEKGRRPKRVSGLLRNHLGQILIREVQPLFSSLITVTRVAMTPDLLTARVFLTVLGPDDPHRVLQAVEDRAPQLRQSVASAVNLKYNPQLVFELDPEPEWQLRLDDLIPRTNDDDQESD
ncbi:MAG: 30S ribosome-binding factor RbfA [Candidatus Aminicenantes bacterium]|nr:30S ribosome-binding factor RbfA [Candidatus Aminicenantes bacterium]